jgi:argininosuccinate lyase
LGWLTTMKGLPSGYNKDLQEDKEAVFDAERSVIGSIQAATAVVASLTIRNDTTEAAATGLLLATDVADYLVSRGLAFRHAHEVVGGIVRDLLASGRDFTSLTPAEWKHHHELFDDDVVTRITARGSVEARKTPQSTHPRAVRAALDGVRTWIAARQ